MEDIQKFLYEYTQETHTIREILIALEEKGLTEEEVKIEFKKWSKSTKVEGFDEHPW